MRTSFYTFRYEINWLPFFSKKVNVCLQTCIKVKARRVAVLYTTTVSTTGRGKREVKR